jgi:hypothetical protein
MMGKLPDPVMRRGDNLSTKRHPVFITRAGSFLFARPRYKNGVTVLTRNVTPSHDGVWKDFNQYNRHPVFITGAGKALIDIIVTPSL